jgi:hypothetical protein
MDTRNSDETFSDMSIVISLIWITAAKSEDDCLDIGTGTSVKISSEELLVCDVAHGNDNP